MGWTKTYTYGEFDGEKQEATICHSTYKDNKFLPKSEIVTLESFKDSDPYYYMVYCLGEWGVLGDTVFNKENIARRIGELKNRKPQKCGYFVYEYHNEKIVDSSIKWVEDCSGYIKIFEDVLPGHPYIIGGDTAGEGSDRFTGQVIDNSNEKQVATLRHKLDEDLYARQMYCLGRYYNDALLSIETNFSTYPVKEVTRLGYYNQFVRVQEDNYVGNVQRSFGFNTNKKTRPIIISRLVEVARDAVENINDLETLYEMLTFVRNADKKGRAEAEQGAHDDLVMALAIAYYTADSGQQRYHIEAYRKPVKKVEKWTQDMLDDYYNADEATRQQIVEKWGEPDV